MAASKWKLIDKRVPVRKVVGRLRKAYLFMIDGDLNFQIEPFKEYHHLIEHSGVQNADGRIECEIETLDRHEDAVLAAFQGMEGRECTAIGVWVNDTPHDNKTELHPLDALMTRLRGGHMPHWTRAFKKEYSGTRIFVHRIFAAADQSDKRIPPLSDRTRTTHVEVPYPPKPPGKGWEPDFEPDIKIREHTLYVFDLLKQASGPVLRLAITPRCHKDGEPGLILLDVVTYWKREDTK